MMGSDFNSFDASGLDAFQDSGFDARTGGVPLVFAATGQSVAGLSADGQSQTLNYTGPAVRVRCYPDSDGTVYAAGNSTTGWHDDTSFVAFGSWDETSVVKLDSSGTVIWRRCPYSGADARALAIFNKTRVAVGLVDVNPIGLGSNDTVYVYDDDGTLQWSYRVPLNVEALCFDSSGNVYAVCSNPGATDDNVYVFSSTGSLIASFKVQESDTSTIADQLYDVSIDSSDSLLVMTGLEHVYIYTTSGTFVARSPGSTTQTGDRVLWGSDGYAYFGGGLYTDDSGSAYYNWIKYDSSLGIIWSGSTDQAYQWGGVAIAEDGSVFVIENQDQIRKLTSGGVTIWESTSVPAASVGIRDLCVRMGDE